MLSSFWQDVPDWGLDAHVAPQTFSILSTSSPSNHNTLALERQSNDLDVFFTEEIDSSTISFSMETPKMPNREPRFETIIFHRFFPIFVSELHNRPMSFPWASQMIQITSRSGWSTKVYEPLIRHRWAFYNRDPSQALAKLQQLPPNTIQAILEHLYANTPVARTNLPAFKSCKIVDSIPFESTYHRDMTNLLQDEKTCDFSLLPRDSDDRVNVHRFMLFARSNFFRQQFEQNPAMFQFRDPNMSRTALQMFAGYLYTGRLEPIDAVAFVDLFGAGENYQLRDKEEIDFLAMNALSKMLTPQNAGDVKARAEQRGVQAVISLVNEQFPC